jgi:glutathione S-transferase
LAGRWTDRPRYPNLEAWVRRFQSRPAYLTALARAGASALGE